MARNFLKNAHTRSLASKIIFTDEKVFKNNSDSKTEYVNRKPNTAYKPSHMKSFTKGSSVADVNIWTYIGPFGKGIESILMMLNFNSSSFKMINYNYESLLFDR